MFIPLWIILLLSVVIIVFVQIKWSYGYWKRRNIPYLEGKFPFGVLNNAKPGQKFNEYFRSIYEKMKNEKYFGIFFFTNPILVVNDLEMIKELMITNFRHFHSRGAYSNKKDDPYTVHIANLTGEEWHHSRRKFSTVLSSGKLKLIYQGYIESAKNMLTGLREELEEKSVVDLRKHMQNFSMKVIGYSVLGLNLDDFKKEDSIFKINLKKACEKNLMKEVFLADYPQIGLALRLKRIQDGPTKFFKNIIEKTADYRYESKLKRDDLFQVILNLTDKYGSKDSQFTMDDLIIMSYAFIRAGLETTSSMLTWTMLHLASNPDVQEQLRSEIIKAIKQNDGEITYEGVQSITYLTQVMKESMRLSPPVSQTIRRCNKTFKFSSVNLEVPDGMRILIPIENIQRDPRHFPNPHKFDPERFNEENLRKMNPMSFMPFGAGPRSCVGNRFAIIQAKVALVFFMLNFKVSVDKKTHPIKINLNSQVYTPVELWLKVEAL